jgi:hypothetical protein
MARQQTAVYRKVAARSLDPSNLPKEAFSRRAALTRAHSPEGLRARVIVGSTTSGQIIPMSYTQSVSSLDEPS